MAEIYFSTDIETDGPIPGPYSMLSFGTAAFTPAGDRVDTFTRNLHLLDGAGRHPETMKWWARNRQAFEATRESLVHAKRAMTDYVAWIEACHGKPVFVAYPAGFDFLFIYWYLLRFVGRSPFSFSALDMKSYAMAKLGTPYRDTVKRAMPKAWFSKKPHSHVALDDAIEQGELFIKMLNA